MHSDPSNVKKPLVHASGFTSSHGQQQAINFVNRKLSLNDQFHEQNFFFLSSIEDGERKHKHQRPAV
jgi:hypothetical protein